MTGRKHAVFEKVDKSIASHPYTFRSSNQVVKNERPANPTSEMSTTMSETIKSAPSHSEGSEPSSCAGRAASSVASARELLEERAQAAAAALSEKMRAKAAERAAVATAKAEERARKGAEREAAAAARKAEREAEKARKEEEREAEKAARKAERAAAAAAAKAAKEAEKAALPKRPRGRPKKVAPVSDDAAADHENEEDDFESDSDGEETAKPCPPAHSAGSEPSSGAGRAPAPAAAAIHLDFGEVADGGFAALREPSPRPTTPMRHFASLQAENAALRARLERAEAALAAIRAALHGSCDRP
jgi:hypothetical protein